MPRESAGAKASLAAVASGVALTLVAPEALGDFLRKGPWLMDLHPTSVVVLVERAEAGTITVRAELLGPPSRELRGRPWVGPPTPPVVVESPVPAMLHEVTLPGLRPGMRYRYHVQAPDLDGATGTFTTPPLEAAPFRFAVYGDTRSGTSRHRQTVAAVQRFAPDFVLHTGDLVGDGTKLEDWQTFFDVERPLLINTPLVPVVGNHEIIRPLASGLYNYRRFVHVDPTGPAPELDYVFRFANARFILANAYDDWTGVARDWLAGELARARREGPNDWLFVAMHWGPRSAGVHGNNRLLHEARVDDLLRRARVDLVFAGHDHVYERGDDHGLRYIVSGGGGAGLYGQLHPHHATQVFASEHHFVLVEIDHDRLVLSARRIDGTVIDQVGLTHDGWTEAPRALAGPPRPAPLTGSPPAPPEAPPEPPRPLPTPRVDPTRLRLADLGPALLALLVLGVGVGWRKRQPVG
ncbi:MAG: metallophosphoesterase [Deltaproteobacteria bacterium]|nr:metallophosphoesterase [Deltaproteobacteria bacterium]